MSQLISAFKMTFRMTFTMTVRMTFTMTLRMTFMMTLRMTFKNGKSRGFPGVSLKGTRKGVLLPRSRSDPGPGQVQVNFNSGLILFYFSRA